MIFFKVENYTLLKVENYTLKRTPKVENYTLKRHFFGGAKGGELHLLIQIYHIPSRLLKGAYQ